MNEKWARERREREGVSVRVYGLTDSHERQKGRHKKKEKIQCI